MLTPVREYHAKYYVPHNVSVSPVVTNDKLCLHMDGAVNVEELFDVLNNKVEPMILEAKKGTAEGGEWKPPVDWKRPFVETTTANPVSIPSSQTKVVEFMEEDESMGEFITTFLGPAPNEFLESLAVDVMGAYLTYSATSPLLKEFVEIAEPKATSISIFSDSRVNHAEIAVYVGDVPAKYLTEMPKLLLDKLRKIATTEGIDMDRMRTILRREKRQMLNRMETSVSSVLADTVIQGGCIDISANMQTSFTARRMEWSCPRRSMS